MGIREDSRDFGRGFTGICEDSFVRLWERICKDSCETLGEDSQDFGRGFARICETLGEDSQDFGRGFVGMQGFVRLWERIHSQGFTRLWERICKDL